MLVILTEERSMKIFLEILINRYYLKLNFNIIPHQGKQDLERHIPKTLRSWNIPDSRFIVAHDKDSWDCHRLKLRLKDICKQIRNDVTVRIACTELES
jgi:hypothetical protein